MTIMAFGSDGSLDDMVEEEEQLEERIKLARKRTQLREEQALLKQAKKQGMDTELYRKGGQGTGMDWSALKLRI